MQEVTIRIRIERRLTQPRWLPVAVPAGSLVVAFVAAGLVLLATGHDPLHSYRLIFDAAFVDRGAIGQTLVSATPLRERIALSYPPHLRRATAAGIGLLLTFLGLQNGGFVAANPATMVGPGPLDHRALFTLLGLFVSVWLARRENPFAYLAGIVCLFAVTQSAQAQQAVRPSMTTPILI